MSLEISAPMIGTVTRVPVEVGDVVAPGTTLVVLESMKMEHRVVVPDGEAAFVVGALLVSVGDGVRRDQALAHLEPAATGPADEPVAEPSTAPAGRPDLDELLRLRAFGLDENRPDAVARRRSRGQRTARENVADLVDAGTLVEYGPLVVAAQRARRSLEDLQARTPADGLVTGVAEVDGVRTTVLAYDATVLAGTQGLRNHAKTDRILQVAAELRSPVVLFAEGGGGRPGDTDVPVVAMLNLDTFHRFAALRGQVPLVGIAAGRCFAGNAVLLGACDVVVATRDSTIGVGGPAMVEGGGLGVFVPEQIGPAPDQAAAGVVDLLVDDEAEAVAVTKTLLGYLTGRVDDTWTSADQEALRDAVPLDRVAAYAVRPVIERLADDGTVLELGREHGREVVTALVRVEGRPYGVVANSTEHLGGAIDVGGARKLERFVELCATHGLPVVSLCDTPGFMVGPDAERGGTVRAFGDLFTTFARQRPPMLTVILRKAYGLGAMAMTGGGFTVPVATLAWPTGEVGAMGLEGAVKLALRQQIEAIDDPQARQAFVDEMVAAAQEQSRATNAASIFELDDVIDPAETRAWITRLLGS